MLLRFAVLSPHLYTLLFLSFSFFLSFCDIYLTLLSFPFSLSFILHFPNSDVFSRKLEDIADACGYTP